MLDILTGFAACCRAFDLRVSTGEVIDAARHLGLVNPADPVEFRLVLRANFVKSRRDQARFDYIFDLFFNRVEKNEENIPDSGAERIVDLLDQELRQRPDHDSTDQDPMDHALVDFLDNDPLSLIHQLHRMHTMEEPAQRFFKSNMGQLSSKLSIMLQINALRSRIETLVDQTHQGRDSASLKRMFMNRLDRALDLATREPEEINDLKEQATVTAPSNDLVSDKPLANLTPLEVNQMEAVVERLVRKLKDRASRRFAVKNRGAIDIKKTLRNSGKFQGVPLDIVFRNKPPRKSSILAICDVSGSVWSGARFMLTLLYSLHECFFRVKSFVFVADLVEVTDLFDSLPINHAIDRALEDATINRNLPTDYGSMLQAFRQSHMNDLNQKTTLIILGDGRSNFLNPQANILAQMREHCRRIIWLTPEHARTWTTGDCEIMTYKAHCHEVRTIMNLSHLMDFIKELVV
ncbi:MAG: VWA domain-containing protein [Desulfobacterium sp.]|nr:VWA domain-containing protein [Desulfobacterium sp.]